MWALVHQVVILVANITLKLIRYIVLVVEQLVSDVAEHLVIRFIFLHNIIEIVALDIPDGRVRLCFGKPMLGLAGKELVEPKMILISHRLKSGPLI